MPTARQELATAALNGKVYVIGGYDSNTISTDIVEVYDPVTNTWATAHPIPFGLNHNSAAVAAGKLYSFGGFSTQAFVYNEANDSWSAVASMKRVHDATPAVGVFNDKIYVAGGAGAMKQLEVYDPVTNTWKKLRSMKTGRNHCAGAFIAGKFYVVGGRGSRNAETAHEVYDPQTNKWTRRAPLPTGRSGIAVGAVNGELFVFGGETPMKVHGEVEAYNPATNTWRALPDMPVARHGIWASVIGNKVFISGGATEPIFAAVRLNQVFTVGAGATEILSTEMIGSNVVIKFRTHANHTYRVERTEDPSSGNWIAVSDGVVGTGGVVMVLDVNAGPLPMRSYRVIEL
jgi:N-acetylneuraminic acid mutarotase